MEDPKWLRLITIGLVLSALAVGYFLLTGRLTQTKTNKPSPTPQATQQARTTQPTPSPSPSVLGVTGSAGRTPLPSAASQSRGGKPVATLPNTGFPQALAVIFSASALAAGFGLRKYPN